MKITGKIIRNIDLPSCVNCIHYRPSGLYNAFSNTCEKFGTKDVVTGKITYNYADSCRSDNTLCGKEGNHFEKEPRLWLKKVKHTLFRPMTFFYVGMVAYLLTYYIKFLL